MSNGFSPPTWVTRNFKNVQGTPEAWTSGRGAAVAWQMRKARTVKESEVKRIVRLIFGISRKTWRLEFLIYHEHCTQAGPGQR